jgi:hypothetical protein
MKTPSLLEAAREMVLCLDAQARELETGGIVYLREYDALRAAIEAEEARPKAPRDLLEAAEAVVIGGCGCPTFGCRHDNLKAAVERIRGGQ